MTPIAIFVTDGNNPWFNLATENWLIHRPDLQDTHILYLWKNAPCIVIGRYQNPWKECNLKALERDSVILARRYSGGGAVYHDMGNTCFTFISPKDTFDKQVNFDIVIKALADVGITAQLSGRNDLLVDDRKVSGSAFQVTATRGCHHGTLLINADLSKIAEYLTPDKQKLQSKGIQSVASRVANLSTMCPKFTSDMFKQSIVTEFCRHYGTTVPVTHLNEQSLGEEAALQQVYQELSSDAWRFGKTPTFTHTFSQRTGHGRFTFELNVIGGVISEVTIYSDSLSTSCVEQLTRLLTGCPYDTQQMLGKIALLPADLQEMGRQALLTVVEEVND